MRELASISKVTSICSCPFGFFGSPLNSNSPKKLLSLVNLFSPSKIKNYYSKINLIVLFCCENLSFFELIVKFLGNMIFIVPPVPSIPKEKGVTSIKIIFSIFSCFTLVITAASIAAPQATASC